MTLLQLVSTAYANGSPIMGSFVTDQDLFEIIGKHALIGSRENESFILNLQKDLGNVVFRIKSSYYHARLMSLAPGTVPRRTLRFVSYQYDPPTGSHVLELEWIAADTPTFDGFYVTLLFKDNQKFGTFELGLKVHYRFPFWKRQLPHSLGIVRKVRVLKKFD